VDKAALHSYALSQRFMLRDTKVRVLEIAPPWVRAELMNSQEAEQAMPINQFIAEAIAALRTDAMRSSLQPRSRCETTRVPPSMTSSTLSTRTCCRSSAGIRPWRGNSDLGLWRNQALPLRHQ